MFLIDKYRPETKDTSEFHNDILSMLEIMSNDESIAHIIFYGPDGSGKKTIMNIFLKMLFGEHIKNSKSVSYEIESSGGKKTIEKIKQSNYHIEINPTGTNYDRYLIHDIVKKYARTEPLNKIFKSNKKLVYRIQKLEAGPARGLFLEPEIPKPQMNDEEINELLKQILKKMAKERMV